MRDDGRRSISQNWKWREKRIAEQFLDQQERSGQAAPKKRSTDNPSSDWPRFHT
jgi:hypothetical protein